MQVDTHKVAGAVLFGDTAQPWRLVRKEMSAINPIGSMITHDESRFLYWLAAEHYAGAGKVVDLGPLAGGSTYCLARGISDSALGGQKIGLIHSYDMWQYYEDWARYFPTKTLKPHDDILPSFMENLSPFTGMVIPHKGDIAKARWTDGPIEILFVDAAKAPNVMEHIVSELYPMLIPGRSILIQQDYVSAEDPWIHIVQEFLSDYFELLDSPDGGTVAFRAIRQIPKDVLKQNFYQSLYVADGLRLLDQATSRLRGWNRLCVMLSKANYLVRSGNRDEASGVLDAVMNDVEYCPAVHFDTQLIEAMLSSNS